MTKCAICVNLRPNFVKKGELMAEEKVKLDVEKCVGCGICVDTCEKSVLEMADDVVKVAHPEKCDGCNSCVEACPNEALTLSE